MKPSFTFLSSLRECHDYTVLLALAQPSFCIFNFTFSEKTNYAKYLTFELFVTYEIENITNFYKLRSNFK